MANQLQSALDRISRISHELQQASNMLLTAVNNGQVGQSMAAKLEIARRQCLDVLEENNYGKVRRSDIQRPITINNLDDELLVSKFISIKVQKQTIENSRRKFSPTCRHSQMLCNPERYADAGTE